jgi:hypothetical protein
VLTRALLTLYLEQAAAARDDRSVHQDPGI